MNLDLVTEEERNINDGENVCLFVYVTPPGREDQKRHLLLSPGLLWGEEQPVLLFQRNHHPVGHHSLWHADHHVSARLLCVQEMSRARAASSTKTKTGTEDASVTQHLMDRGSPRDPHC
ncbi:uncharacterized protein LOC131955535 [Physella acuta]|uniref:uncharacterized protein LOC131955535 n=1 Tax=Physella acuta TaxID=109671 RepID=UPI0027DCC2DF|nr:uncharacterized protein LOC131955535 [Physella acuta]